MKLFKKATAVLALVTLMSGIFSTGVSAYSTAQKDAADSLAADGIIVQQSDAAAYNLDQNVLRQEIAAVARGVADEPKKTTCDGTFSDVTATTPNDWACYSVEALSDAWLIALNDTFRPEANISKAEAVGMMVKAAFGDEYAYDSSLTTTWYYWISNTWQQQVVAFAVEKGVVSNFTNYDTAATRGFVFEVGASSMDSESSSDDLLNDLIGDLLGDDPVDDTNNTGSVDVAPAPSLDNVLTVTLSPDTAKTATIPWAINGLPVASFDFTAWSEDVTITSLIAKRNGLSDSATLTSLAVFTTEGRVSKGKNDSEENNTQATLNLNSGWVTIMAWETETFTIVVDVVTAVSNSGDEFAIELLDVNASSTVEGVDNLVANTMKVGWVDAGTLTVDTNGSVSNPNLGADGADLFKFKLTNGEDFDMIVKSLTFKWDGTVDEEDELANFKLIDNDWNIVSEVVMTNGKYLTFDLGDGFTVAENKTEKFKVTADVIGGASKTIKFFVDKNLDITAEDTQYGFGASVTITNVEASGDLGTLTVQAGELTLVDIDPVVTKIREDKKDIDLGKIKIINNAGTNLEIQKFGVKFVITDSGGAPVTTIWGVFENIELYDETNGTTYDLATVFDGTDSSLTEAFQEADLNITVPVWEMILAIRADTVSSIADFDNVTVTTSVSTGDLTANGWLYIVETDDDTVVTDITPSSLSYKTIDGSESSATVTVLPLSTTKNAVIGSADILAFEFEVEADESSKVFVDEIAVDGSPAVETFNNAIVTEVKLYKDSVSEANLLDRVSGSQIASEVATFDWFRIEVPANGKTKFLVTVSILDDATIAADTIKLQLLAAASVSAEDEDNDDVTATGTFPATSARLITVTGAWTLAAVVDNTDPDTDNDSNILGNTTTDSPYVASYEMTATNEGALLKTLVVRADETGNAVAFETAVSELLIFANDKEIARETVTSDVTTFENVDYVVAEWSENLYVKVITRKIGKDAAGDDNANGYELEMNVTKAEWDDSGKTITVTSIDADGEVGDSNTIVVTPTRISAVAFVSSYGGTTVDTTLTDNVDQVLAIVSLTTDSSTNTDDTDGSSLSTELVVLQIEKQWVAVNDVTITRINGNDTSGQLATDWVDEDFATGSVNAYFDMTALTSDDDLVDNSSTAYFKIEGKPQLTASAGESVKISLINLDSAVANEGIDFTTDSTTDTSTILALNLGFTEITGASIVEAN